jgi:hexokinase
MKGGGPDAAGAGTSAVRGGTSDSSSALQGGSRAVRFLRQNRMHWDAIDIRRVVDAYLKEMGRGLQGAGSSLPMIPTYIETARAVPRKEKVIALDAGGTNFRAALVSFDESGKPLIEGLVRQRMPGADAEMDRDEFFRTMAGYILPLARASGKIGFCFSYAAEMQPSKDGKLLYFTKEIKARGVVGELIGGNLARALAAASGTAPHRTVLLNDTVATLLAGRNAQPGRRFDDFIGVVCGTGINVAYVESNRLIGKVPGLDPAGAQIINTESGSFAASPSGKIDDAYDATTAERDRYRHEKMISGAYLGALCLFTAKAAARAGCLSPAAGAALETVHSLSTRELNDFLLYPDGRENPLAAACSRVGAQDARCLYTLCDLLVERAAVLVAVTLSAILLRTGRGGDPRYPVCIAVDGTTFWQLRSFRCRVEAHMRGFLRGARERAWEITSVEDAPLLGAAIAALTN